MSYIYFWFSLILLVTFHVSSHQLGWYNCTIVYHPKLHQRGKSLATIGLALALHPRFVSVKNFVSNTFSLGLALMGMVFFSLLKGCQKFLYTCIAMPSFVSNICVKVGNDWYGL